MEYYGIFKRFELSDLLILKVSKTIAQWNHKLESRLIAVVKFLDDIIALSSHPDTQKNTIYHPQDLNKISGWYKTNNTKVNNIFYSDNIQQ